MFWFFDSKAGALRRASFVSIPFLLCGLAIACGGGTQPAVLAPVSSAEDALMVGAQPRLDELRDVVQSGRGLVISLRLEGETGQEGEEEAVVAAGGRFERIPVAGAAGLTRENVDRLHALLDDPGSTVLHCGSGNRAGALLALHAFLHEGADPAAAVSLGEAAGLASLRPAVEERLRQWCDEGLGSCAASAQDG